MAASCCRFTMTSEGGRRILNIHLVKSELDYLKTLQTMYLSSEFQKWSDFGFINEIRLIGTKDHTL
jgi:hypothetical protein